LPKPDLSRFPEHWKEDSDLAGIRDPAVLAKLPQDERTLCQQLWGDVDGLLNKVKAAP
jgi:hypothetical protein